MKCIKICGSAEGTSYFAEGRWSLHEESVTPPSPAGYLVTKPLANKGVLMMHHPAGYRDDWHKAPAPVLGTVLRGNVRISTSDGDSRLLRPGAQFLAADLTGAGHKMEAVDGSAYDLALVVLDRIPDGRALAAK